MQKNLPLKLKKIAQVIITMACVFSFPSFSQSKIEKMTTGDGPKDLPGSRIDDYLKIHSLGLGIGHAYLSGDFASYGDDGMTWDIYYNYSASHSFDLLVNFHWNNYSNNNGGEETLTGLVPSAKVKFYQFDSFTPYVLLGLGFYMPELSSPGYESQSKIVLGLSYGLGLDLRLNRHFVIGAIFQVHNPFDVSQDNGSEIDGSYSKLLLLGFYSF